MNKQRCETCNKLRYPSCFVSWKSDKKGNMKRENDKICDECRKDEKNEYDFPRLFIGDMDGYEKHGDGDEDTFLYENSNRIQIQTHDLRNKKRIKELFEIWINEVFD